MSKMIWPPEKTIKYAFKEEDELTFEIPLEGGKEATKMSKDRSEK